MDIIFRKSRHLRRIFFVSVTILLLIAFLCACSLIAEKPADDLNEDLDVSKGESDALSDLNGNEQYLYFFVASDFADLQTYSLAKCGTEDWINAEKNRKELYSPNSKWRIYCSGI